MRYTVFDLESDGLLDKVTKIHCFSYQIWDNGVMIEKGSLTAYSDIIAFCSVQEVLIGHNIIRYDIPVLRKILGITVTCILIDTLGLSWYLYPLRKKHGLEVWGDELGVPKPIINDWNNLDVADYIHRCESDVEINQLLWTEMFNYLNLLYDYDTIRIDRIINYLNYKLDCAREQEEVGCKIDKELVDNSLRELYILQKEKLDNLVEAMPSNIKFRKVEKPAKTLKKDGTLSALGVKWYLLLQENNLPNDYNESVMVKISEEPGNPASSTQMKDWLYSLGWEPITFEYRKNKAGDVNPVAQIYVNDEVCSSIKELYDMEPALENLDMLSLINHRIGIFIGYRDSINEEDFVRAEIAGFTNTLRFKHKKPIVNLPKVFKFYGEQVRGAIIAPDDRHKLCGSDMSSLEDSTKQHYMYFFDPEYVTLMRIPGFDPHLDIAVLSGMLTDEQSEAHKKKEADYSQVRNKAKTVNFAGVYGAGAPKIALTAKIPLQQAQQLHKTYWERNKSVKQVANSCTVKTIGDQMWLYNPVSRFWYSLRYDKDKFSTLNQGTGVFCFDLWVREVRNRGIRIMMQYHDEIAFPLLIEDEGRVRTVLTEAIESVNQKVKLNVPLGISIDFGINYAKIH
jgi:hypothetical protein